MNIDNRTHWYNFKTKDYDYINPSDFTNYIPQQTAAQNLYDLYIKTGFSPLEAAIKVLSICVSEKK